ncbi:hypothetical protein [Nonomuraea sp. NPDC049400]|uniref:hypothetical protein n=1 Tax=Nonomuraea sp. NPDC049400 TaxID=3364352 RepID=UPI0037B0867F
MRFEEQLLMDLKAEIGARADRRRRVTRRLFAGGAVAALAAAAAIGVPLLTGTETPAYAVSKNGDGTIRVEIKEFRDADKLEQDLKTAGVTADVTYLKAGTKCRPDRGELVGGAEPTNLEEWRKSAAYNATRPGKNGGVDISPQYIGDGQTLVLEFAENSALGPGQPGVRFQFATKLIAGQVKPCVVVDDPSWNDAGGSEGQPPAGS